MLIKQIFQEGEVSEQQLQPDLIVDTFEEYIKLFVRLEDDLKDEDLREYTQYYNKLAGQAVQCQNLFSDVS